MKAGARSRVVVLLAAGWFAHASAQLPADSPADRWNLAEMYPSIAAWDVDAQRLVAQFKEFAGCKGRLGDSAARFRKCLDLQADMTKRQYRLATYSYELLAEDTGAAASLELNQRAEMLGVKLGETTSFVKPELLRLGSIRIARFVAADPRLKIYRHPLEELLRTAPHTLNAEGEALVAQFSAMNDTGSTVYTILTDADMPWPMVKLSTGEEVRADESTFGRHLISANRDDRKRVMDAYFGTYRTYERTLGVALYSQMKQDAVLSKVRKYPDTITRKLDASGVPVAVFETLIAQANANLSTLHRYFRLRARLLDIAQLRYYDLYLPLVRSDLRFSLSDAKLNLLEAVATLGPDYVAGLEAGLSKRWMDAYPRMNKMKGAHTNTNAYDVHPYLLLNHVDNYESMTTLAHEWGHAMHTYLANKAQPFVTSDYSIFVAEIASTFNEQMLLDRMLRTARTDDERLLYLGAALEDLRGTFFMQAMNAEFERDIHARVDKGESLTGEMLTGKFCELLKRYSGAREGALEVDDGYCIAWARNPVLYNSFYSFQYATSIAASSLFAQKIRDAEPGAQARYLDLLRAGASDYPYDLVKAAGLDLATTAPYRALIARMNGIMDEIEAILAKRK